MDGQEALPKTDTFIFRNDAVQSNHWEIWQERQNWTVSGPGSNDSTVIWICRESPYNAQRKGWHVPGIVRETKTFSGHLEMGEQR